MSVTFTPFINPLMEQAALDLTLRMREDRVKRRRDLMETEGRLFKYENQANIISERSKRLKEYTITKLPESLRLLPQYPSDLMQYFTCRIPTPPHAQIQAKKTERVIDHSFWESLEPLVDTKDDRSFWEELGEYFEGECLRTQIGKRGI